MPEHVARTLDGVVGELEAPLGHQQRRRLERDVGDVAQVVRAVGAADVDLERGQRHHRVAVVEERREHVVDGQVGLDDAAQLGQVRQPRLVQQRRRRRRRRRHAWVA